MAESASIAFGRYVRTLRERRGLSLLDVVRLSGTATQKIDKGSLSRLENGGQGFSVPKLAALSRIYEISPEVLIERLELDRELEAYGGPETKDLNAQELLDRGRRSLGGETTKWDAYGYFRDGLSVADGSTHEKLSVNLAGSIRALGKNRLALNEFSALLSASDRRRRATVLDRIANCHRCLGDRTRAERFADEAVLEATRAGDSRVLAFAYQTQAQIMIEREEWELAIVYLRKAFRASRAANDEDPSLKPNPLFEVLTLHSLADCYIHMKRLDAARRATLEAKRLSEQERLPLGVVYTELNLGRLEMQQGHHEKADFRLEQATRDAIRLNDRRLAFSLEVCRLENALESGKPARARAIRKQLERLAPWVPSHVPLVTHYHKLIERERTARPERNSAKTNEQGGGITP